MKKVRIVSFLLTVVMVITCAFSTVVSVSAATSQSGDVVYFDNTITGYAQVYAYMWGDGGSNANFPGELMTKLDGNIWGYTIKGNYDKIIFSQGDSSGQSDNLSFGGNGMLATPRDNGRFQADWSEYKGDVTLPTSATESTVPSSENQTNPTTPSESTPSQTVENVIYCKNDKGWSKINVYMWNNENDTISSWPGKAMTDLGEGVFELKYNKVYVNAIFNTGSEQTGDLTIPAGKNCYNNSTGQWEYYVPSDVRINKFATNRTSVCYVSCDVEISAEATSVNGAVTYKFSVADSSGEVVLSNGSESSVVWVPSKAGEYVIKVVATDSKGKSCEETMDFTVGEVSQLIKPFINTFYNSLGTKNQIMKNTNITFTMNAVGGNVGNNLLFYKFEITEPDSAKNIPYYTTSSVYSYTPVKLGDYQIRVSVQNSDNTTVTEIYRYKCVEEITEDSVLTDKRGDLNGDGITNVRDVTTLQMYLAKIIDIENKDLADFDKDGRIAIKDVTYLQMVLCKIVDFK